MKNRLVGQIMHHIVEVQLSSAWFVSNAPARQPVKVAPNRVPCFSAACRVLKIMLNLYADNGAALLP